MLMFNGVVSLLSFMNLYSKTGKPLGSQKFENMTDKYSKWFGVK